MMTALKRLFTPEPGAWLRSRSLHILVIITVGIILTLPAAVYGLPFFGDDSAVHTLWYSQFSHQLWAGELYPRWLQGMNGGLGSPALFYYPPASYFLTSVLHPFYHHDPFGWYQLGLSVAIAMVASGLCAYLWLRQITSRNAAFIASLLYMSLPYHLAADLYVRAAFAEYYSFVWMPLILFFTVRIIRGGKASVIGLAISYFFLILTHLPTTLIFSLIPLSYAIFRSEHDQRKKALVFVIAGMVLGIGLSAIYLLPAMFSRGYVFLTTDATGYFYYENWFLFTRGFWEDKVVMGLLVLDMTCLAVCAFVASRSDSNRVFRNESMFWFCVAVISALMMTPLAKPVYKIIPALQLIQFPWRFNAIFSVATIGLLAMAIATVKRPYFPRILNARVAAMVLMLPWLPVTAIKAYNAYPITNPNLPDIDYKNRWLAQHRDAPEYRPRWSGSMASINKEASLNEEQWDILLDQEIESLLRTVGESNDEVNRISAVEGTGKVEVEQWKPRYIVLHTSAPGTMRIDVSQFYYPGWTASLVGETGGIELAPSNPAGLLRLSVPSGEHEVKLTLNKMAAERIGQFISEVALVILALLTICFFYLRFLRPRNFPGIDFETKAAEMV